MAKGGRIGFRPRPPPCRPDDGAHYAQHSKAQRVVPIVRTECVRGMNGIEGMNGMEGMTGMKGKKGVKGMGGGWGCDGKGFRKVCRVHGWWTLRWGRDRRQVKYTSVNHYWYTRTYK